MIEGIDYCFIYPKDDAQTVHIRLLVGDYKDTVFKFGKCIFKEQDGDMHLVFAYDVLESTVNKPKKLEKDTEFKNYIGNLLIEIMSSNMDQEVDDESE